MRRIVAFFLAAAFFVSASANAAPPVQPVNVVNTPDVNVVNTPNVNVVGTPAVTISGTPTVIVANQRPGRLYNEVLQLNGPGGISDPGTVVPNGMRRTITHVSAEYSCSNTEGALVRIHSDVGSIFLPGTQVLPGRWIMTSQVNVPQRPGGAFQLSVETNASNCAVVVFLAGVEVPEQP
jgi:hypothetical protein